MIEVVFGDSACGSLKMAQHAAEERRRLDWEEATPMGGSPQDVFGFPLMLSIGDIAKDDFIDRRQAAISALWSIYPNDPSGGSMDVTTGLRDTLTCVLERAERGEDIRIWYSNQPDELCGLYWFLSELRPLEGRLGAVQIVKLPEYEYRDNHTVVSCVSWGEVSPGEWSRYTELAETTTAVSRQRCTMKWDRLQQENAPLRAVLNGQLLSVPEDIYDSFIRQEIAKEGNEFHEAIIVGRVLGRYQLGIGDAWITHRIEKMIGDGDLMATSDAAEDEPSYHRRLKKTR